LLGGLPGCAVCWAGVTLSPHWLVFRKKINGLTPR